MLFTRLEEFSVKRKREEKRKRKQQVKVLFGEFMYSLFQQILIQKSTKLEALKKRHKQLKDEVSNAMSNLKITPHQASQRQDLES